MLTVSKAAGLLNRPHLMRAADAPYWASRLANFDPRAFERRGNTLGIMARLASIMPRPNAMEDDDEREPRKEPTKPAAYQPRWLGPIDGEGEYGWTLKDGIALLSIDTPLVENGFGFCGQWFHGYDSLMAAFEEMDADNRVKGVFTHWKSPGGVVAPGIYDLTTALQNRRRAAKEGGKPTWSYCEMACSAAYWLPSQTDNLVAPKVGMIGSIGAVLTHVSLAGMYAKEGIKITPVQFGKFKTAGASFKDLTDEELAHLQAEIDELGEDFLAAVEAGRGDKLTAEMARATEARVFLAQSRKQEDSALALGFIDAVMPERDAFEALKAAVAADAIVPNPAPAAPKSAAPAATLAADAATLEKEKDVKTKKQRMAEITALPASAMSDSDKLKEIQKILDEPGDDAPAEDPPEDAPASAADEPPEEDKDAKAAKAKMVDPAVAQAILALPEAKGREGLAQRLALKPGMTVEDAKADLAAAPRGSAMVNAVHDPKITGNGGAQLTQEQKDIEAGAKLAEPKRSTSLPF